MSKPLEASEEFVWKTNPAGLQLGDCGELFSLEARLPEGARLVPLAGIIPDKLEHGTMGAENFQIVDMQSKQVLTKLLTRLERIGLSIHHVYRVTVYLVGTKEMISTFNDAWKEVFKVAGVELMPTRALVLVKGLVSDDFFVEIVPDAFRSPKIDIIP
ncbi:MAG: Rid family hydrolase [bacterium]